ncbi:MAG: hypothetical protein C4539_05280 [Ignavibacteriales bacterium]|nr:MAG: hypothetical protein C4539_05280 [Ignavibacteriales bacterium]
MRKKNTIKKEEALDSVRFCTECGEELENFSISDHSSPEDAQKQHDTCKETGKFNGDMCSRVFITKFKEEDNLDFTEDTLDDED